MSSQLRLRDRTVTVEPGRPLVMGIVNANPDSFSDDVRTDTLEDQVQRALTLVADGADLVDVGGESGVTYNDATPPELEIARVVPIVERLVAEGVLVSVVGPGRIRLVTHHDVDDAAARRAAEVVAGLLGV